MTTAYDYIKEWIVTFLSQSSPVFNGLSPCPYARKALIDNKVNFITSVDYVTDITGILDNWNELVDVVVVVCPDDADPNLFERNVLTINQQYLPKGFACLEDHKDLPEVVNDVSLNNGKYNIVLCQRVEKLNQAADILKTKGYYTHWSKEYYNDVVTWREESSLQQSM
jgi:hypothetical protein